MFLMVPDSISTGSAFVIGLYSPISALQISIEEAEKQARKGKEKEEGDEASLCKLYVILLVYMMRFNSYLGR